MFEVPPGPSGLLCDIYTVMVVSITRPYQHTYLSLAPLALYVVVSATVDSDMQKFSQPWSTMRTGQVVPPTVWENPRTDQPHYSSGRPLPGPDDDHFPPDPWTHDDKAGPCSRCLAGERVSGRQRSPPACVLPAGETSPMGMGPRSWK